MTDLLTLPGIGKMARDRLIQNDINTIQELGTYILQNNTTTIREFILEISLNPQREECLEGYYPRIHNKRIKDGLISITKQYKPQFTMTDYKTLRVPLIKIPQYVIRCDTRDVGSYIPFDNSIASRATTEREGIPYRGIPGGMYRNGKSCIPPSGLTTTARDALLHREIYRNRRQYKCSCFRNEVTCNDMNKSRNNRIIKTNGKPKEPYCKWNIDKCTKE